MEPNGLDSQSSTLPVGQNPRQRTADYGSITADNQQDILLRRRRKAIAVFEKDMLARIESSQRLEAKRFLNNLQRSEMLLKEHESTKRTLFTRHSKVENPRRIEDAKNHKSSTSSGSSFSKEDSIATPEDRVFSGRLKRINDKIDVPYIKLDTYTKEDLKRPSTALELKRKAWEKVNKHLEENRSLRPASAGYVAKCEKSVPRNVRAARERLRTLTKVRLLARLPPAPPRIDVEKVQTARRDAERIEKEVVSEFCQSLEQHKLVLPSKFCWMDVNEVYLKNSQIQKKNKGDLVKDDRDVCQQTNSREFAEIDRSKGDGYLKTRRRRKGQQI